MMYKCNTIELFFKLIIIAYFLAEKTKTVAMIFPYKKLIRTKKQIIYYFEISLVVFFSLWSIPLHRQQNQKSITNVEILFLLTCFKLNRYSQMSTSTTETFIDDLTITAVSHIQARWILNALKDVVSLARMTFKSRDEGTDPKKEQSLD